MEFLLVWLVLVICTGIVASNKGRNVLGWVAVAVFVAPVTILILLALPSLKDDRASITVVSHSPYGAPPSDAKTCPRCAETVKRAALVCRFCSHEFPPLEPTLSTERRARFDEGERPLLNQPRRDPLDAADRPDEQRGDAFVRRHR